MPLDVLWVGWTTNKVDVSVHWTIVLACKSKCKQTAVTCVCVDPCFVVWALVSIIFSKSSC